MIPDNNQSENLYTKKNLVGFTHNLGRQMTETSQDARRGIGVGATRQTQNTTFSSSSSLVWIAGEFWRILGKVFMTIGVVDSILRIRNCQRSASTLAVGVIVCVGGDCKMTHLMNNSTL